MLLLIKQNKNNINMVTKDTIVGGKYKIEKLIGEGAFGKIYLGICHFIIS